MRQPRFDPMRDREIDIVASEKQMVADGDSLDVRNSCSGSGGDLKEREVGRATADVNNQDVTGVPVRASLPDVPLPVTVLQPPVKCGLWFLQKAHILGKTGLSRRVQREPLSHCVKGGRNGNRNFLFVEP